MQPESLERARERMRELHLWGPRQHMGRRWPVGCVALEITQRCNLDCTACYLSESSEALHDLPLEEVFRRIGEIRACYGLGTDVQVTGGRVALEYAEAMTAAGVLIPDELFARLRRHFGDDAIVELTALIAFQNLSSKFNSALGVPAQGFCNLPRI